MRNYEIIVGVKFNPNQCSSTSYEIKIYTEYCSILSEEKGTAIKCQNSNFKLLNFVLIQYSSLVLKKCNKPTSELYNYTF